LPKTWHMNKAIITDLERQLKVKEEEN